MERSSKKETCQTSPTLDDDDDEGCLGDCNSPNNHMVPSQILCYVFGIFFFKGVTIVY